MKPSLCGCRPAISDGSGNVVSVSTCPQCLPAGAIHYLIDNGRQLELQLELPDGAGVAVGHERSDLTDPSQITGPPEWFAPEVLRLYKGG